MINLPLYLVLASFLAILVLALLRRKAPDYRGDLVYPQLLVPCFLLPLLAALVANYQMPQHALRIHGYRVALERASLSIGSDARDDLILHHAVKDQELIEKGLLEIRFDPAQNQHTVVQTQLETRNIVSVNGLPLRSLKLEPGRTHRISFKEFGFSEDPKDVLELTLPEPTHLVGDLYLHQPVFSFRGQRFHEGFSHELGGPLAALVPNMAVDSGAPRHLAWRGRLFHKALETNQGSLLRQASLIRQGSDYYLAANDAEIRLNGEDFPKAVVCSGPTKLLVESHQLGSLRRSFEFTLTPPVGRSRFVNFAMAPRSVVLPEVQVADRICLSAETSVYSQSFDIKDPQFPARGMILSREDDRFVFRGSLLVPDAVYTCGKVVFSIGEVHLRDIMVPVLFGLLFSLAALLVPFSLLRRMPLLGPILASAVFLHALRQVFGLRAWLGQPYNLGVFLDSASAVYLLVLTVTVLLSRESFAGLFRSGFVVCWNFLFPKRAKSLPPLHQGEGGRASLLLFTYGLLLLGCFWDHTGWKLALPMSFLACVSLFMGLLDRGERAMAARPLLGTWVDRALPALTLLAFFGLALASAPLLGGREIIPFLPGRLRPDIFIQIVLILIVAYQASLWDRDRVTKVAHLGYLLLSYLCICVLPLIQGLVAEDMGFFMVVVCPLGTLLLLASWPLDQRIRLLAVLSVVLLVFVPVFFTIVHPSLENVSAQRLAFWLDKTRLRQEAFFNYQAQVPILWSSAQGFLGAGFFQGDWYNALRGTAVNDNVASVFIQGELGGLGTILIMGVYGLFCAASVLFVADQRERLGGFRLWLILGVALTFCWAATAMFLQNFGYLPLTGKNLPFLGLDSLNDTLRYSLLLGLMLRYQRHVEDQT